MRTEPVSARLGRGEVNDKQAICDIAVSTLQRLIQPVILVQIHDLRTSVAKEACQLIIWISQEYPSEFVVAATKSAYTTADGNMPSLNGGNGVRYFRDDGLPKLISSGNKLI